jgi:hypothetical protein
MAWYKSSKPPLIIAIVVAFIVLFSFYYPGTVVDEAYSVVYNWITVVATITIWVGVINIVRHWTREAVNRTPGKWYIAIFGLLLIVIMIISGFGEGSSSTAMGPNETVIKWLYNNYYFWGEMGLAALSGCWTATAIYRAFRIKNLEAVIFLTGGVFAMMQNVPIGGVIWSGFPIIGNWIMSHPFTAIMRAFTISIAIGVLAYIIRFYTGKEKGAMGV